MKGFIIFQNQTSQLLYSKNYNYQPFTDCQKQPDDDQRQRGGQGGPGKPGLSASQASASGVGGGGSNIGLQKSSSQNLQIDSSMKGASGKGKNLPEGALKFSKESVDYINDQIDDQDPQDLAIKFHAIMQITKLMGEEYREMYPERYQFDPNCKIAFRDGFTGMKSDSADFILEHCAHYPLTLVLFYDSDIYLDSIMKGLAINILDVFLHKFESLFAQGIYRDLTPKHKNYQQIVEVERRRTYDFSENPGTTFESALPLIFHESLIDYIKQLYVNLNTMNIQVPWIYILRNKDLLSQDNRFVSPTVDKELEKHQKELRDAIKEEEEERRRAKARRPQKMQSPAMNDAGSMPELNAYLSTQNNDGRAALTGVTKDQSKVERETGVTVPGPTGKESQSMGRSMSQSPKKQAEVVEKDQQSEATHATGKTKRSGKSARSTRSNRSSRRQHLREKFITEQAVERYERFSAKDLLDVEKAYEFDTDEESVYPQYEVEPRRMPTPLVNKFHVNREPGQNKTAVKDMIKRFQDRTQTYEFMIKFNITVEKTDESTISANFDNTPGEIVDQKERRRYIRKEMRLYNDEEANSLRNKTKEALDRHLFDSLLEVVTKASQLINILNDDEEEDDDEDDKNKKPVDRTDKLKYIEMQLNMYDQILEKAKVIVIKLDKVFIVIPYTVSKIELRMRNILINNRPVLDGISHFMNFYLINQEFQKSLMKRYQAHLTEIENLAYEEKFKTGPGGSKMHIIKVNSGPGANPAASNNFTTNYSSNMPPVQSASMNHAASESVINVAVGESAFVNSNMGITIDKH